MINMEKSMEVQDKLMSFIRRDGRKDAPFIFLTIEDGGEQQTVEQLEKTLDSVGIWQPTTRKPMRLGKPGDIISKIMVGLRSGNGSLNGWKEYKDNRLYILNEMNLKFYPIARPNAKVWNQQLAGFTGLTNREYMAKCRLERPAVLRHQYHDSFENAQLIVVLAELEGWKSVISPIREIADEIVRFDDRGKPAWIIYLTIKGEIAFVYFNVFRLGIKNAEIQEFCRELMKYGKVELDSALLSSD